MAARDLSGGRASGGLTGGRCFSAPQPESGGSTKLSLAHARTQLQGSCFLPQRQGGAGAGALPARQGTQTPGLRASSSADVADGDTQHESRGGQDTAPTSDRLSHAAILEMTGPMPGNHPKDSHKRQPSNAHAFPLYWRGQDHAARQFWHARLTPFTRSHRSRATRSRLPRLPRPALSLRGWRPGAGRTCDTHTATAAGSTEPDWPTRRHENERRSLAAGEAAAELL